MRESGARLNYTGVICILRGDFVEEVADILDPERDEKEPPPFVHLRYVVNDEPYTSGQPF